MIIASKDIVVLETKINDEVICQLNTVREDEVEEDIKEVIKIYVSVINTQLPDVEIFQVGSYYIITENRIYIAVYEDEITELDKLSEL